MELCVDRSPCVELFLFFKAMLQFLKRSSPLFYPELKKITLSTVNESEPTLTTIGGIGVDTRIADLFLSCGE